MVINPQVGVVMIIEIVGGVIGVFIIWLGKTLYAYIKRKTHKEKPIEWGGIR